MTPGVGNVIHIWHNDVNGCRPAIVRAIDNLSDAHPTIHVTAFGSNPLAPTYLATITTEIWHRPDQCPMLEKEQD